MELSWWATVLGWVAIAAVVIVALFLGNRGRR